MKLFIGALCIDGIMFSILACAMLEMSWAQNIVMFMCWFRMAIIVLIYFAKPWKKRDQQERMRQYHSDIWMRYDLLTDVAYLLGVASMGWFGASTAYAISVVFHRATLEEFRAALTKYDKSKTAAA